MSHARGLIEMGVALSIDLLLPRRCLVSFGDSGDEPPPPPPPDSGGPVYGGGESDEPEPPEDPEPEPPEPDERRGPGLLGRIALIEWLLKYQQTVFEDILEERELARYLVDSIIVTILGGVFYGLVVGISVGGWQILYNPVKMPWIFIFTLLLCLPSLYIFSAYSGSRLSLAQTAAVAFNATAVVATILIGFAPVTWFFMFTAPEAYHFSILLNVFVFAVAGFFGVQFLFRASGGIEGDQEHATPLQKTLAWWVMLYAVVGAQMAWLLRPFFSGTDVFLRERSGNFFMAVLRVLSEFLTG
jgi:hypothetical protein